MVIQHLLGHASITTALYACGDQEVKDGSREHASESVGTVSNIPTTESIKGGQSGNALRASVNLWTLGRGR